MMTTSHRTKPPFKQCVVCGAKTKLIKSYDGQAGKVWLCQNAQACIIRRAREDQAFEQERMTASSRQDEKRKFQ